MITHRAGAKEKIRFPVSVCRFAEGAGRPVHAHDAAEKGMIWKNGAGRKSPFLSGVMMEDTVIRTRRLTAGTWRGEDTQEFIRMNADSRVMRYFPRPLSPAESMRFLERIIREMDSCGYGLFAVRERASERFVGFVGLHRFDFAADFAPGVEVGWRLLPEYWGRGYAPEMAAACLAYARDRQGLERVHAFTAVVNRPSERVMEKIGMQRVKEFDHPALEAGHPLSRHVLYVACLRT